MAIWAVPLLLLVLIASAGAWWLTRSRVTAKPLETISAKAPEVEPPVILGMIYIPAGSFLSGEENTPTSLPAYYIDETEVSNADFAGFCNATNSCLAPTAASDLPVVRVTVAQARAFAAWKGKRLPTALEWERAARGTGGNKYPWGEAEDPTLANVSTKALMPVKSFARYPEYQMAGNAWEMVEGNVEPNDAAKAAFANLLTPPLTPGDKWITMRGGSFNTKLDAAAGYEFARIPERYSSTDIGFRCAKSAP
jgi:serine/threonine-protein kinase